MSRMGFAWRNEYSRVEGKPRAVEDIKWKRKDWKVRVKEAR
jgi:hypothetical protein